HQKTDIFFFSSRRRHTRSLRDWSSDVCSSDLLKAQHVSDSWLDMRYGTAFKDYLLRTFRIRGMLGFQSQVFPDVLVRPVVILARSEERRVGKECGIRL